MFNKDKPKELSFIELQKAKLSALSDEFSVAKNQIELLIDSLAEISKDADNHIFKIDEKIGELCIIKRDYESLKDSNYAYYESLKRMSDVFSESYKDLTHS